VAQIVIRREWPRGTVGYLVSVFSVLGMLALLFVHPIREASSSRWVRVYARRFYLSLFPLVALLILGTWRRVSEYGITEKRYLLLALGIWIAGVALYFLVSRRRDIRAIPISLCGLALLASVGPWSAASVSRADQVARLRGVLERHGLLRGGKIQAAAQPLDFATRKAISGGLDYLNGVHRGAGVRAWFDPKVLDPPGAPRLPRDQAVTARMMTAMNLVYVSRWQSQGSEGFSFYPQNRATDTLTAVTLGDYSSMTTINFFHSITNRSTKVLWLDHRKFEVSFDDSGILAIRADSAEVSLALVPMARRLRTAYPGYGLAPSIAEMTVEAEGRGLAAKLVAWGMNGTVQTDSTSLAESKLQINQLEGALFLRVR